MSADEHEYIKGLFDGRKDLIRALKSFIKEIETHDYCEYCGHFNNEGMDRSCCTYKCWIRCECKRCHPKKKEVKNK